MSSGTLSGLGALLVMLAAGCRGGLNDTCRCAADCRAGLVCRSEGEKALSDELCYKPGVSGLCVESEDVDDSGTPVELTDAPMYIDMPSKRDFQPSGSISDSLTATGSSGTTDATTSTSSSSSTGDTSTSTGTGTSTGDTSTSSTGTSTGDTSTGSSSSSSSSGSSSSGSSSSGSTGASTGSTT